MKGVLLNILLAPLLELLPEGAPFWGRWHKRPAGKIFVKGNDTLKIFELLQAMKFRTTLPRFDTGVYKEKETIVKIVADIIVQRGNQKMILIGEKHGKKINGNRICETFIGQKVF